MALTKNEIVDEIKRSAAANGGVPPGWRRFRTETGIGEKEWLGKHWARWSEALRDAGFDSNKFNEPYSEDELLEQYAKMTMSFGRIPTDRDMRLAVTKGAQLPNTKTFMGKFGGKVRLIERLREYCHSRPEYSQVAALCETYEPRARTSPQSSEHFGVFCISMLGKLGQTWSVALGWEGSVRGGLALSSGCPFLVR